MPECTMAPLWPIRRCDPNPSAEPFAVLTSYTFLFPVSSAAARSIHLSSLVSFDLFSILMSLKSALDPFKTPYLYPVYPYQQNMLLDDYQEAFQAMPSTHELTSHSHFYGLPLQDMYAEPSPKSPQSPTCNLSQPEKRLRKTRLLYRTPAS